MTATSRALAGALVAASVVTAVSAYAGAKLKGWVTHVDERTQTIQLDGRALSVGGLRVSGGPLEPGMFVKIEKGAVKVKPQRRPADDQVIRFPAREPDNPGRVEFSHLRHFSALGAKQCATCHSSEMGLRAARSAPGAMSPALASHGPASRGRFCASCHDGSTMLSPVGKPGGRRDLPVFTMARTDDARSCQRCHAPADHGQDFTVAHGDIAEHSGSRACRTCHRQDWEARDRQLQADVLAAERTLKVHPDDPGAALAVGPNNFCVSCHRTDREWQE